VVFGVWTQHVAGHGWVPNAPGFVAIGFVVAAGVLVRGGRVGAAFAASAVAMAATVASIFVELHPRVMVSSTGADLTISNTAAGSYSLGVMTVIAAVLVPVVLAYTVWTYVVLRARVRGSEAEIPRPRAPEPAERAERPRSSRAH
jgi:cytochrome d ubiquinol oxidase subunit II